MNRTCVATLRHRHILDGPRWYAECETCDWEGETRSLLEHAVIDANQHESDSAARGSEYETQTEPEREAVLA